ncbi:LrgA family protein [[Clostridium] ultunense Esp]|uniref:LrgA family protein n=1 Tax=[Clostridium] ultunense Esp TaxID=1288971 RepID=M1Z5F8_9FIRM|nr:CidA/LrgA family protein [Schnuerera ultunensis]CCQ92768.1 LrgA family protein [[Clostridium] ultunense Esp]SHD75777.1 LrgA family protein [[Clostridium] ultunense Esp]
MKTLKEFSLILIILFTGQVLQQKYNIPVPGTILGMIILLLLLITKVLKIERIEKISNILLEHLTLFFVPSVVGIMNLFDKVKDIWVYLLIILLISTIVVILVTGLTVQVLDKYLANKRRKGA